MQVRDLDAAVQRALRDAAAREGLSLSAFLRRELTRMAKGLEVEARADNLEKRNRLGVTIGFSGLSSDEVVALIHEGRRE